MILFIYFFVFIFIILKFFLFFVQMLDVEFF